MPAPRALRLLRPLLARPAQLRAASTRGESSCSDSRPAPPCPPCAPAPRPPCRSRGPAGLPGRRVVCCPPPQGARPPCAPPEPACALTCDSRLRQGAATRFRETATVEQECGAESDRVARRMREQDECRQRLYERDVAERKAAPPTPMPSGAYVLPGAERRALATDGRAYTVLSTQPPPGCPPPAARHSPAQPPPSCPPPPARHPPAQPVDLAPVGDCAPRSQHLDPCAHHPRVMLSIDRSGRPAPSSPNACDGMIPPADPEAHKRTESPEPKPLPQENKCQVNTKSPASPKGLTSRIIESLSRGRGATSPGRGAGSRGTGARRAGDSGWCASPPPPAPAPARCREPTVVERLKRSPRGPCGGGARRLHTSAQLVCTKRTPPSTSDRDATLTAAKKLEAVLQEREQLQEAGRGRVVRAPSCAPPPPPRGAGGALELRVPPGADTVCVRVSLGAGARAPPAAPAAPAAPCGGARPPGASCSDSWLSIKNLQKKLSGCARGEAPPGAQGTAPLRRAPGVAPVAPPPRQPAPPCSSGSRVKMADFVPHTIFVKS